MSKAKASNSENDKKVVRYDKDQLLRSIKYQDRKDVLQAVLKDGKRYTTGEVDDCIKKFMEGKVK